MLSEHRIATVADVRSFPRSRKWPQFNQAELEQSLAGAGIAYRWMKSLGGRRHSTRKDSPHTAWEHPAFRSYADYAESAEFAAALGELIATAAAAQTAFMCSEGLWWKCHRRIISDYLTIRAIEVVHIMPNGKLKPHVLASFARVVGDRIVYDSATA